MSLSESKRRGNRAIARTTLFFLAPVVAGALLAACGGNGEDHLLGDQADLSVVPSATPGTAMKPPAPPNAQRSDFGAEAQVRYALDVIDHAVATGDTERLQELSQAGCVPCADVVDLIDAGKPGKIQQESVVRGSTVVEGDASRTTTRTGKGATAKERQWHLVWTGKAWEFGSLVG